MGPEISLMSVAVLTALAGIGLLAMLAQWVAWWVRLPAILFLLLFGVLAGPVSGLLHPDALFGELLFPMVSLAVAIILFEGAMTLRFQEIGESGSTVRNLVTLGALVTWFITSMGALYFMGFDVKLAFLFGAVVVVTGPTVVVPMLRSVRPNGKISRILRWEGIIIDPLGALLAVLAFDFYIATEGRTALMSMLVQFGVIVGVGTILGVIAGYCLAQLLRRYLIPDYLRSVMTLLLVVIVFTAAELLHHETGLLAVTVFGITLANMKEVELEDILNFKESLSILLISGLFVILAARVDLPGIMAVGGGAIMLLLTVMFVARPVAVFLSTIGSNLSIPERLLIAWIGPRGIVCAAVAALFALRLEAMQIPEARLFVPLAFLVIIGTVVIQSTTGKFVAHWLKVRDPAPTGILIVGAGMVARAIGKALKDTGLKVVLTDSNYENIRAARMEGLETFYGNPVSEHADRHLELSGIGKLMSMSGRANLDVLVALNFRPLFGPQNVYELPTSGEGDMPDKHRISDRYRGTRLFGSDMNYNKLAGWLNKGAEIKSTTLTETYDFYSYMAANRDRCILLFAMDPTGRLRVFTGEADLEPQADWKVISAILPPETST